MIDAPIVQPTDDESAKIMHAFDVMRQASALALPDPVEWLTFANAAASMFAGYLYRSAVHAGIELPDRHRTRMAIKLAAEQFKYGMKLADAQLPNVLENAGIATQ